MKPAKPSLNIQIPHPCSQQWDSMPQSGTGRHCSECSKVIYDFSLMSDDELLSFFKNKPATNCGRFHVSQLQRDILPEPKRRSILFRFNKVAAALFTFLSFKTGFAKTETKQVRPNIVYDSEFKVKYSFDDNVTISGTITGSYGKPVSNARILFDQKLVATTDENGKFAFALMNQDLEMEDVDQTFHHLYFEHPDFITAVRTYNRDMLSTSYEVNLEKPGSNFSMGIMLPPGSFRLGDLPSIIFKPGAVKLTADNKIMLESIAAKVRNEPRAQIRIVAYYKSKQRKNYHKERLASIKEFLINGQGIHVDRIKLESSVNEDAENIVDIVADDVY